MAKDGDPPSTLILLTLNEIEGVRKLWGELPRGLFDELLAVDGGSVDGTVEYLQGRGIPVIFQRRPGRGEAFRVAAEAARGEHLVYFSPDGNEDPGMIGALLGKLREGYDMAVASRFLPGASDEDAGRWLPVRSWGNRAFTWIANRLWNRGRYLTDTINGFRAVTRSAFRRMDTTACGFSIELEMSIRAMRLGLKVAELATRETARAGGRSKAATFAGGLEMCRTLWTEWRRGDKADDGKCRLFPLL